MKVIKEEGSRPIKAWVGENEDGALQIEDEALHQAKNHARLPFFAGNGVALMPDVHAGKGSTIGSVIATDKAIIPAAVGVDIGCGMNAVRLSLKATDLPDSLAAIRGQIERDVPLGAGGANDPARPLNSPARGEGGGARQRIEQKHPALIGRNDKARTQLGSLGSGNHFIELCLDENHDVWILLHFGF